MKNFLASYNEADPGKRVTSDEARSSLLRSYPLEPGQWVEDELNLARQHMTGLRPVVLDQVAVLGPTIFRRTSFRIDLSARGAYFRGDVDFTGVRAETVRLDGAIGDGRLILDGFQANVLSLTAGATFKGGIVLGKGFAVKRIEFGTHGELSYFQNILDGLGFDYSKIEMTALSGATLTLP